MKLLKKKEGEGGESKESNTEERPLLGRKFKKKRKHLNYTAAEATGDMWM